MVFGWVCVKNAKFAKRVIRMGWKFAGVFYTKIYEVFQNFNPQQWKWYPLWIFQVFLIFALFLTRLFNFDASSPKWSKKIHFQYKVCRWIEFRRLNWLKYQGKVRKSEKFLHIWKIHNAKTPFLNLLKLGKEIGN